jgi:hypothetical protein
MAMVVIRNGAERKQTNESAPDGLAVSRSWQNRRSAGRKQTIREFASCSLSHEQKSELQIWLSQKLEETLPEGVADQFRKAEPCCK